MDQQWIWRENQALARRLHAAKLKGASVEDIDYGASRGLNKSVIHTLAQKSAWAAQHEKSSCSGQPEWVRAPWLAPCSLLIRLSRIDVLVIDDWAMAPLADTERCDS